mgnify:CR=1 FL=1
MESCIWEEHRVGAFMMRGRRMVFLIHDRKMIFAMGECEEADEMHQNLCVVDAERQFSGLLHNGNRNPEYTEEEGDDR